MNNTDVFFSLVWRNARINYWSGEKYAVIFIFLWCILINLIPVWKWETIIPATRRSFFYLQPRTALARWDIWTLFYAPVTMEQQKHLSFECQTKMTNNIYLLNDQRDIRATENLVTVWRLLSSIKQYLIIFEILQNNIRFYKTAGEGDTRKLTSEVFFAERSSTAFLLLFGIAKKAIISCDVIVLIHNQSKLRAHYYALFVIHYYALYVICYICST